MLKRLWTIFGPLMIAIFLVISFVLTFPIRTKESYTRARENAVALTPLHFKNGVLKRAILSDSKRNFIPFFGSSEWKRMDSFHPSVLAEAYDRPYRPLLLGERGSQSLVHYFGMQQISNQLHEKKAVYFVSPQWFNEQGATQDAFQEFFSLTQLTEFLKLGGKSKSEQVAAERLLQVNAGISLENLVVKVANEYPLSDLNKAQLDAIETFSKHQESLYSYFLPKDGAYQDLVKPKAKKLPKKFSYEALDQLASKEASKMTNNNEFAIANDFFNSYLDGRLKKLKGFQSKDDYRKSIEYNDFQLVLSEFAKQKTEVIFVIPPVNKKWADYTGLNQEMYQETVEKIKYQLMSQGFTNIADFSKEGDTPYFMEDTIHIGWRGWLALDKTVNPFLTQVYQKPNYRINDRFLSQDWADYTGDNQQFQ